MSLEIKKNKKKLYQERNSKRKKKYNNQKLCDNNEILIINKKLDLQGFCNGNCIPIIKKNNYCINFNKYEKIFLVGFSFGANLSLHASIKYPKIKAVAALSIPIFLKKTIPA